MSSPRPERPRVGYLGPQGTFSEEAALAEIAPGTVQPVALETIQEAIAAVRAGEVEWAVVPIENSLDGSIKVTLDRLADWAGEIEVVGEALVAVRHVLAAAAAIPMQQVRRVLTHPMVPGQCRALMRDVLPHATVVAESSTAEAVRIAAGADPGEGVAAIGPALAAEIYNATILMRDVQDSDDNLTRFVWLGRSGAGRVGEPPLQGRPEDGARKTSLVFWGAGAGRAGWLVQCLDEFGRRGINLTKIESRPRREQMGQYMFFVDLEADIAAKPVTEAIDRLRGHCEQVRILGSYQAAEPPGSG